MGWIFVFANVAEVLRIMLPMWLTDRVLMRSRYAKNDRHAKCAKRVVFSAASEVHEFHCKEACHSSSMHVLVHGDPMAHSCVRVGVHGT